jgi:hypothetical protein
MGDVLKPNTLVWENNGAHWYSFTEEGILIFGYTLICFSDGYLVDFKDLSLGHGYTLEGAKKAAQAHADREYYTKMSEDVDVLIKAVGKVLEIVDALYEESGKYVAYDEEDAFRRGEWFDPEDILNIENARIAIAQIKDKKI